MFHGKSVLTVFENYPVGNPRQTASFVKLRPISVQFYSNCILLWCFLGNFLIIFKADISQGTFWSSDGLFLLQPEALMVMATTMEIIFLSNFAKLLESLFFRTFLNGFCEMFIYFVRMIYI